MNPTKDICFEPIGIIHTEFQQPAGTPIQPAAAEGHTGSVEVFDQYTECLDGLDGFSHIFLIYFLHQVKSFKPRVTPFLGNRETGLFSTRAPVRPNPIGLSVVEISGIDGNIISIKNPDMLEGTPLLDIKPYVFEIDSYRSTRHGWIEESMPGFFDRRADDRFVGE
ncbi:MAG: tRNA (N6-threonylcarbamoyladenosine(37)-N6)-methyltransferase TrmO [Candidatus Kapaibacterium sp.]